MLPTLADLAGRSRRRDALNDVEKLIRIDRLRQIPVHPSRQAAHVIPLHRMSGQAMIGRRDPLNCSLSRMMLVHSKPSISCICTSMSTQSNPTSAR
jgi:hypothetical protein